MNKYYCTAEQHKIEIHVFCMKSKYNMKVKAEVFDQEEYLGEEYLELD